MATVEHDMDCGPLSVWSLKCPESQLSPEEGLGSALQGEVWGMWRKLREHSRLRRKHQRPRILQEVGHPSTVDEAVK